MSKWAGISTNNPKVTIFDLHIQKNMREKPNFNLGTIHIIQLDKSTNLSLKTKKRRQMPAPFRINIKVGYLLRNIEESTIFTGKGIIFLTF
ncbi:hypothetical protein SAMN03084138_04475 [Enterovibrio norvegicus DSM 15893]|uniref:Uncharacterized protein n=1 Tax=Enterovibrio norvegicus DSM 15893 TaxID=1121869 RepID=A0A1I5WY98_9GAMM|nr:hypothetical protein SAMN03084138_04475 [Enterovibrio norvegicus DSM 15893]